MHEPDGMTSPFRIAGAWFGRSIGARILTLTLGLLLALQVANFAAIRSSLDQQARSVQPDRLKVGERVLQSLLDQIVQRLAEGARRLAADDGLHAAVLSNHTETVASMLGAHGARIGATETALLGTDFALRAASGGNTHELMPVIARLARQSASVSGVSGVSEIALLGGRPHQVVLVPLQAPKQVPATIGWVAMGIPLETTLVPAMKDLSALDLTLLARASADAPWAVALTSLPTDLATGFAHARWPAAIGNGPDRPRDAVPPMQSVALDRQEFGVRAKWLTPPPEESPAGRPAVLALVSLSIDAAARPPRDLQIGLALITLIGFAVFGFGGLFTSRRMSEKQAQILELAYWDSLTGLPNRLQFRDAVHAAIARAQSRLPAADGEAGAAVAVIMLDLDRFKHVNDVLGRRVGDLLLGCVGERLSRQVVRDGDLVARLGGDEFAVLLREGDAALAESVAQRIATAFDLPLTLGEHTIDMGAGIGMACWPQHGANADALLSHAEVAMVTAKRRKQGPLTYHAIIDAASAQTLSLLTELRQAVDRRELRLYLQPKLMLDTGRISGAETLVRWLHPHRGLVPPTEFIPLAEQTGFIRTLTMWVFEEAARHWLALQAEGVQLTLSVNLSARDLLDPELPQKFDALLVKHRVPAEAFCLEITESAIMGEPQRALGTLNRLSALGFKLSIDDFGTGYSSLAGLKRLPVDELKIDRSFVLGMESDLDDAKIVRATIALAHNLGLTVVAEGVENAKSWDMLRALDCDEAQGYHMGRPMPATEFSEWSAMWMARHRPQTTVGAPSMLH
jgi:diguanylate cyclase (GGDEF)-like protein